MNRRRWLLLAAILVAMAGGLLLFRGPIALMLYRQAATRAMAADRLSTLPAGLHVGFCGTGSPLPDPERAGPCTLIIAGRRMILIDAGEGAARNLQQMGFPAGRIERVLLTHFHSDHIDGLGALALQRWVQEGARTPLPLHGPTGVAEVAVGFNSAYAADAGYRTAHHGAGIAPPGGFGLAARPFVAGAGRTVLLDDGDVRITAFRVNHGPVEPAVGYRIDHAGACVTVSGDTAPDPLLVEVARGCDLLVHEALQPRLVRVLGSAARAAGNRALAQILHDIENYHSTPEQAAMQAARARVGALALTHIVPPLRIPGLEAAFLGNARQHFGGHLWIASDRELFSLPARAGGKTARGPDDDQPR